MIKNILFDFGGVIVDADLEAACDKFRSLGLENISDYLNLYRQNGIFLGVEEGSLDRKGFCEAFCQLVGKNIPESEIEAGWLAIIKDVKVEKLQWIEQKRKEYKIFMLSNINPFVFDWAYTTNFSKLGRPLPDYFDHIFASYKMGMTKPSEEIFQKVLEDAQIAPEETLFIDDGTKNIETAKRMGFVTYQPKNGEDWRAVVDEILSK